MKTLALLLLVGTAHAQGLTTLAPGQTGQKRTNYAPQSNTVSDGANGVVSPWTYNASSFTEPGAAPAAYGGGRWTEITSASAGGGPLIANLAVPSSAVLTLSAYMRKASGTGYASLLVGCGAAPSLCTCWRSDGGTCSAAAYATNYCKGEVADLGTSEMRLAVQATCPSALTVVQYIILIPGQAGVAVGTTRFTGIQLEVGARTQPSKICATTTAARTCK